MALVRDISTRNIAALWAAHYADDRALDEADFPSTPPALTCTTVAGLPAAEATFDYHQAQRPVTQLAWVVTHDGAKYLFTFYAETNTADPQTWSAAFHEIAATVIASVQFTSDESTAAGPAASSPDGGCSGWAAPPTPGAFPAPVDGSPITAAIGIAAVSLGADTATVDETDSLTFSPANVTVRTGQIVTFRNSGSSPHDVTWDAREAPSMSSGTMSSGDVWQVEFLVPGTYTYICSLHSAAGMKGSITVR